MKVFLMVSVDVAAVETGQKFNKDDVAEAVEEAVFNALRDSEDHGYDHKMRELVSLTMDYVRVTMTDLHDDF